MNTLMYKSEYRDMYNSEEKLWWYVGLRDLIKYYLIKYSTKNSKILDAGCGTGKNMQFLISLGFINIDAFDYSHDAIAFCKQRGLQVSRGNIIDMHYADSSYDVICCMDVISALVEEDRRKAVCELFRVLKPGGLLLCNSSAFEFMRSQHDDVCNIKIRYTLKGFNDLFSVHNPEILKLSYRVFLLFPVILLFKGVKRIMQLFKNRNESTSDQQIFPFGINWLFTKIQLLDNLIFRNFNFPFGSSVFIVARKWNNSDSL